MIEAAAVPGQALPPGWSFACPDWQDRIRGLRSLMPTLPLNQQEAKRAVAIFDNLRVPDVDGLPTFGKVAGGWFREIVAAVFGSYDVVTAHRVVRELFLLVPKKNAKTTNAAGLMMTAMLMNRRPRGRFVLTGATQAISDIGFGQAIGMIDVDDLKEKERSGDSAEGFLKKRFKTNESKKEIKDRKTSATLQVRTFDPDILTGPPLAGCAIDELHLLGKDSAAARVIGQIRGNMVSQTEAFLAFITTQSDQPPAGAFAAELMKARAIRDGKFIGEMLPVLIEFPPDMVKSGAWKNPVNWPMVTPNLNRSITIDRLIKEHSAADFAGEAEMRRWASQHLNIEIGLALASDDWVGALHW